MRRLLVVAFFVSFISPGYSQKEKLAEVIMQSFEKKNYKLLFPHLVPDSFLLKPTPADTTAKEKKTTVQAAILFRMLEEGQWEDYRKAARKNKIDFKDILVKEVVFQETSGSEGNLYIHYATKERQGLMRIEVMVIGDAYYIEFFPDEEGAFKERDPSSIEDLLAKYRAK